MLDFKTKCMLDFKTKCMLDFKTKCCPRPKAKDNILSSGPTFHVLPEFPVNNCFVIPSKVSNKE